MKKVLSFLLFTVLFVNIAYAEKKEEKKDILLLEINKEARPIDYYIRNNELYLAVCVWNSNLDTKRYVYKYEDKKLIDLGLSDEEIFKNYLDIDTTIKKYGFDSNKTIEIDEDIQIELTMSEYYYTWLHFVLIKGEKRKELSKEYTCILKEDGDYVYVDKKHRKIYFSGFSRKDYSEGLYVYDIDKNKFINFRTRINNTGKVGHTPIRISDTEYLMYLVGSDDKLQVWITEIPEWKAEIEAKEKEKQISDEIKYVIDGPANIREKAKGKQVIGSVEDGIEVTILEKKGDWYKIKKEKIEGWTYKDNIKEIKK